MPFFVLKEISGAHNVERIFMPGYGYGMKGCPKTSGCGCCGQHVSRRIAGRGQMSNAKAHDKPIKTSYRMKIKRAIRNDREDI